MVARKADKSRNVDRDDSARTKAEEKRMVTQLQRGLDLFKADMENVRNHHDGTEAEREMHDGARCKAQLDHALKNFLAVDGHTRALDETEIDSSAVEPDEKCVPASELERLYQKELDEGCRCHSNQ